MDTRNTKQREIILSVMSKKENMTHPTMQDIISKISDYDKSIGQATIYRNVNKLVEEGVLKKIPSNDGLVRYDINTSAHGHLTCKNCNKVFDIFDENYQSLIETLERKFNIKISESNLVFNGLCEDCNSLFNDL